MADSWSEPSPRGGEGTTETTIGTITEHARLVLGASVLAVIVAAVITLLNPTYEATAFLSSAPQLGSSMPISYASFFNNAEIREQVAHTVKASLSPGEQGHGEISDEVEMAADQDGLRIRARSDSPQKAAMTANAWAKYVTGEIVEALQIEEQQLEAAGQDLEAADEALRAFEEERGFGVLGFGTAEEELHADGERLKSYKAEEESLKQIITEARTLRASLVAESATSDSAKTIYSLLDGLLHRIPIESKEDALQFQVLRQEQRADEQLLAAYGEDIRAIEEVLARAEALRKTIHQGGSIGSPELMASLAVELLRSGSLDHSTGLGAQMASLPIQDLSHSQQIEILDTIILILESRRKLASAGMGQLSAKGLGTLDAMIVALERRDAALATTIEQLSADISQGEKQMAASRPELERLIEARDAAEETCGSLVSRMEQAGAIREVDVIAPAVEPSRPIRPDRVDWVLNLSIGGVLGFIVGAFSALGVEHLALQPRESGETQEASQ